MAIIKCPECNQEISDKAPVCPSCGVPIAGHVVTCPQCGYTYFNNNTECPHCHHKSAAESVVGGVQPAESENEQKTSRSNNNRTVIAVVVLIVLVLGGVLYAFYRNAQGDKEEAAYEYALSSNDPQVLQNYLDTYTDAPEAHRDSISAHLEYFAQLDRDWTNVVVSGSKSDFERYIEQHPNSPFCQIAQHKIDSIDWSKADATNTIEAVQLYLEQHPDGEHFDEANDKLKALNANTVSPEDKILIGAVFDGVFKSMNNRDEEGLMNSFNPLIGKFLGKTNATRSDVATFLHKIYKNDVASLSQSLTLPHGSVCRNYASSASVQTAMMKSVCSPACCSAPIVGASSISRDTRTKPENRIATSAATTRSVPTIAPHILSAPTF